MRGNCGCGEVKYKLCDKPMFVHACHCTICQRQSGSAYAVNAIFEKTTLRQLSGSLEAIPATTGSGKGQTIFRCSECKIAVWSTYAAAGNEFVYVRVGTLEDPSLCPPDINLFSNSSPSWAQMPEGIPTVEEFYDRNALWSKEALSRRQKAGSNRTLMLEKLQARAPIVLSITVSYGMGYEFSAITKSGAIYADPGMLIDHTEGRSLIQYWDLKGDFDYKEVFRENIDEFEMFVTPWSEISNNDLKKLLEKVSEVAVQEKRFFTR